ncbi:MAG: hypothetical protein PHO44_04205 [Sphaerochaetaceae bacterium]|nr:hypothetical protein [Sphaerochaetaceae bacterium]
MKNIVFPFSDSYLIISHEEQSNYYQFFFEDALRAVSDEKVFFDYLVACGGTLIGWRCNPG